MADEEFEENTSVMTSMDNPQLDYNDVSPKPLNRLKDKRVGR